MATGSLLAVLVLSGCTGGDDSETDPQATSSPTADAGGSGDSPSPAESESPAPDDAGDELYAAALAAIDLAEQETGGIAFEIDDEDDDGSWEVHVAVGDDEIEVTVDAEATEVVSSEREDDLDDDDRRGLDQAGIGLAEAIRLAIQEYGGDAPLDDAGISSDDGQAEWEVAFDDDVEVYLDIADGSVLRVED